MFFDKSDRIRRFQDAQCYFFAFYVVFKLKINHFFISKIIKFDVEIVLDFI